MADILDFIPDYLVIETYGDLVLVLSVLAGAAMAACGLWRYRRGTVRQPGLGTSRASAPSMSVPAATAEFAIVSAIVDRASTSASKASDMQALIRLKLDSTEIAVQRLLADLSSAQSVPPAYAAGQGGPTASTTLTVTGPRRPSVRPVPSIALNRLPILTQGTDAPQRTRSPRAAASAATAS